MEMITTEKIKLTSQLLFKILIRIYLKKRWWLLAWVCVLVIMLLLI
ncbi:MAG: hypothetical protein AB2L24_15235 [Mangrovibacterium sp.]